MTELDDLDFSVATLAGLERRLSVTVPADLVERECQSRLRQIGRSVNIRGYRPGKVPLQVLQQRFGEQVRQEVIGNLVQSSVRQAVGRLGLRPVGDARIDAPLPGPGERLAIAATFEVLPDISLSGLQGISVERPEPLIDDADLDFVIDRLRRQNLRWRRVERACRLGDTVTVNSSGLVDGQQVEGLAGERIPIVLGEGRFLLEVERPIVGMVAGEERQFDVAIPGDFGYADIAGRTVQLTVQVLEVAEPVLPELDAEFLGRLGIPGNDPARFRDRVAQMTRDEFAVRASAEVRRQLFEHLVAQNPIPVPNVLVEQEASNLKFASMRLLSIVDPDKARPVEHFRALAEERVRTELLMGAICEANGIALDEQRVLQRLREIAPQGGARAAAGPDPRLRGQAEGDVREEQVAEWLEQHAVVSQRPMSFRQLLAAGQAGGAVGD